MQLWIRSSYENVFRDQRPAFSEPSGEYSVALARNEYQSFQICLRNDSEFCINSVIFSDLRNGDHQIDASNLTYNYVEYEYVPRNSLSVSAEDVVRTAPDYFPDPLSNDRAMRVAAKSTQPIWITVYAPKGIKTGKYHGTVSVRTNLGEYTVDIAAEVYGVTIPESNCGTLDYMHHQQIVGAWWLPSRQGFYPHDPITICYGYDRWTESWWKLVDDIAQNMRKHRQNILYVNIPQLLLDSGTCVDSDGKFTFKWDRLDEYVRFFMERDVVKGLEGTHIASIDYVTMNFTTFLLQRDAEGQMEIGMVSYDSPESNSWLYQFLPALQTHIQENGWLPIWYQHVGDEAMNDAQLNQYAYYFQKIRQLAPLLKVGDPVTEVSFAKYQYQLGTDIQVPMESAFDMNRALFREAAEKGVRVYLYNCCSPAGSWLNRFVDKPVWNMRLLGWLLYDWRIKGFLHWGFNFWNDWQMDEYLHISEEEYKGDHYTIYPDYHHAYRVRSSIRYEANRDAAQDYELLTILGKHDSEKAHQLVNKLARDAHDDYTKDVSLMMETRRELLYEAASVSGEEI